MTAKLIYRAERHPSLDRQGFTNRWRQHAALGMSQQRWTNIRRYAHCDPVDDRSPWDGVALLWYLDEAARLRHIADPAGRATMRADEAETFARPVREISTLVSESSPLLPAADGFKHFVFIWRDAAASRASFAQAALRRSEESRRSQLAALPGFRGMVLNVARRESQLDGFGLDCDVIEESDWAFPADVPDDPIPGTARSERLLTRHVLLYDSQAHS